MKSNLNRRAFLETVAATTAGISIVPRHVLGGPGYVPPSDQVRVANIGCGTQGLREMPGMLQNPVVRVVAVCDPNTYSTNYVDWSPHGIRNGIRRTLGDDNWGAGIRGIPGGREVARDYVDRYYEKFQPEDQVSSCLSFSDYRKLLEKVRDIDAVKIMTPDHLHARIAMDALDMGKHVITHKPVANRLSEGRKVIEKARESGLITHLLAWSYKPEYEKIKSWIRSGEIGELKEIHNWSVRPVWPQWTSRPTETPPVPEGFDWNLWLGPVPYRPYHPNYTHNVFRGWYDFGSGSLGDMAHYSLFPLFQILDITRSPFEVKSYSTTTRTTRDQVCTWVNNDVAFPASCMIRFGFPAQSEIGAFDFFWYDGGMKPFAPAELEEDGEDIEPEGMLFVGSRGKILSGFRGERPRLIPKSKMAGHETVEPPEQMRRSDMWAAAIQSGKQTPGRFTEAQVITDMVNLGAIALRTRKGLKFDSEHMEITNDRDANEFITRDYREGWEF